MSERERNVCSGRRTGLDKYYHEQREILKEFNDLDALVEMNTDEEERLQVFILAKKSEL